MQRRSAVLDSLSGPARELLLARAVTRRLQRGQALYLAGEVVRRTHLVAVGTIKLAARDGHGNEALVDLAFPGDLIGALAALDGRSQPLDAVAATRAEVVGLDADLLVAAVTAEPAAALALARALAGKIRTLYGNAAERTTGGVRARLAGRLLDLGEALGDARDGVVELELPVAQDELGRLAGMCRESTCKTLRTFKRAGLLDYRGRRVRLLRTDALASIRGASYSSSSDRR
jgi:CRP-like cAMP-binding protein